MRFFGRSHLIHNLYMIYSIPWNKIDSIEIEIDKNLVDNSLKLKGFKNMLKLFSNNLE